MEDDSSEIYRREIAVFPPLTPTDELELSRHVLAQDAQAEMAAERLTESYLGTVVTIAESYAQRGIDVLDLIQDGNRGLLFAIETFPTSGPRFSEYATVCIKEAIEARIAKCK